MNSLVQLLEKQDKFKSYIEDIEKKRHLLEMGLTKGTKIKVKKKAPMGGTISIEVRGYELCISEKEAEKIIIF